MLYYPKSQLLGGALGGPAGGKLSWPSAGGGTPEARCLWSAARVVPTARTGIVLGPGGGNFILAQI